MNRQPRAAPGPPARDLWWSLDRCDRLLALHLGAAVQRFGRGALDVVDLPSISGDTIEPSQLQAVSALFWAREVDAAGLLEFVDGLVEGMIEGRLALPVTGQTPALQRYFQQRHDRFGPDERNALYGRVFGSGGDAGATDDTNSQLDAVARVLLEIAGAEGPSAHLTAQLNVVARALAEQLSARSAGITGFAARSIIDHVRDALGVLGDRQVAAALGGGGAAAILRRTGAWVLGRPLDPGPHFQRAQAGQQLLAWLADVARSVGQGSLRVGPGDPVLAAAGTWQAVTGLVVPPAEVVVIPRGRRWPHDDGAMQ